MKKKGTIGGTIGPMVGRELGLVCLFCFGSCLLFRFVEHVGPVEHACWNVI